MEVGKLDLTLKLSPCGQSEEGKSLTMTLTRKKSNVGNEAQEEGPIVACMERSASLPSEDDNGLLMLDKRRRVAEAATPSGNPYGDPFHHGGGDNSKPHRYPNEDVDSRVKKLKAVNPHLRDDTMEIQRKMPTVTTTGEGRNGRKIKGILYSYEKGEVFIVCVCHASFLSPAEFVKHAGGKQVENPMKLITVCPNSF